MALTVIFALYLTVGVLAAAGSVVIAQKVFSPRAEQIFFGLFLVPIAGFYLAFTAHFGAAEAWPAEIAAVALFTVLGVIGTRVPAALMLGYALHGLWDLVHELAAHAGMAFAAGTEIPLAYGVFCATYDVCMAAYFYTRRQRWRAAWNGEGTLIPG